MILILGGTTEGRAAVKTADEAGSPYFYSTRDAHQQVDCHHGTRLTGALDEEAMEAFCREKEIRLLVDAAHPFAEVLHRTVAVVAERLSLPVVRYERVYPPRSADIIWCDDYDDAIRRMEADGVTRLLALTGVQTIGRLRAYWQAHDACIFRILDLPTSLALAERQGFPRERIVYYEPGGDEALLERVRPQAILTKESGESGGFIDKVEAAHKLGIAVYAVRRPPMPTGFVAVTGRHGFRKQIERFVPGFFPLRSGYTTGSCATAAAKAALMALLTGEEQSEVSYALPDGEVMTLPIAETHLGEREATAAVIKDAGDDPDVTNGCKICFPAGILQYPFFDMQADDAFNYGAIGVVIGHEMTHGFDDQGRQFDKDGNLKNWWTEADAKKFNERAKVMSDFYDSIYVAPGVHANGKFTLGETLADFGGLQIAYQAFKEATAGQPQEDKLGFTPDQRFFLAYSFVWAGNIRDEEILRRTKTDPHALGKWRVNGELPQIDAWYKAFGITESSPMFIPKEKRVTIW